MKPKTLILMVVAITCGLGASYMTSRLLAERQPEETEKVDVLVARKNLDMGLALKNVPELFEIKKFTKGEEPKDAISVEDQLKGRVLKRSLRPGDFVTGGDLLDHNQVGIAAMMAQGYRAIGINVNLASIAGGFAALPHSRVDIISTVRRGSDKDSFSQVLLENVLVLAADTNTVRDENGRAMPANVVTVALKPEDVVKVNLAKELGPLSLVLRKFNDQTKVGNSKVTVEQMLTGNEKKDEEVVEGTSTPSKVDVAPITKPVQVAKVEPKVETPKVETPREEPQVVEVKESDNDLVKMRIIEGDKERYQEYLLNKKTGQVASPEVTRSEPPAPPRPPQVTTPPRPTPTVASPSSTPETPLNSSPKAKD